MGIFTDWQPQYAAHRVVTFPVAFPDNRKKPAVKGYLKLGPKVSDQLALKFPEHEALGVACRRNRITILDIDAPSADLLAEGMETFGQSPFVVRTQSGGFHAYYRNSGETRKIRPDKSKPVDILGDGYVVLPPSIGPKGAYELVSGCLDDLTRLPRMRKPAYINDNVAGDGASESAVDVDQPPRKAETLREHFNSRGHFGERNDTLWRHCMKAIRGCSKFEDLIGVAMTYNRDQFYEPLPEAEVLSVVASVLSYESQGKNWFGHGARVTFNNDEIDDLLMAEPDAFVLLTVLRRHHWGRDFVIANGMAENMPGGGWNRKRFASARQILLSRGEIELLRAASSYHGPALYRFGHGRN
jgi:hypothetical protein